MRTGKVVPIVVLTAFLLSMAVPLAVADTTGWSWASSSIPQGGTDQVTLHLTSAECPSGDSYVSGFDVVDPSGGVSGINSTLPCGTDGVFTYPTDFVQVTALPSTATCGSYADAWVWTVYSPTGALVSSGNLHSGFGMPVFTVTCPIGVPQFPLGFALLFAVMVPAMLVLNAGFKKSAVPA